MHNDTSIRPNGFALLPFASFALFYVGLSLLAGHMGYEMPWYKVSMPVAFLVASALSLLVGRRPRDAKVEIYARGGPLFQHSTLPACIPPSSFAKLPPTSFPQAALAPGRTGNKEVQ